MGLEWSSIATITYFSVYTAMMMILSYWIWKKEKHSLDRTFLKSIWIQKSIYAQVIVHFYDTATDIGVLITWYYLYADDIDYVSVDMAVFFYSGVAVLAFYRFFNVLLIVYNLIQDDDDDIETFCDFCLALCLRLPLAILDLFIFQAIYDSFKSAEDIIKENEERAQKKRKRIEEKKKRKLEEKKAKAQEEQEEAGVERTDVTAIELTEEEEANVELTDIDPALLQYLIMLAEAVFESMPQVSCSLCYDYKRDSMLSLTL